MELSSTEWQKEVEKLGPGLFRYFCGSFPNQIASDLVQDSLIRLVQKSRDGSFLSERGSLKTYAYGIARMIRLEALREENRFVLVEDENELDQATAPAPESDRGALLRWAIRQLSAVEQEVLLLFIDEEFPLEEIATQLALPLGTVKSHIHRAKVRLKEILEKK